MPMAHRATGTPDQRNVNLPPEPPHHPAVMTMPRLTQRAPAMPRPTPATAPTTLPANLLAQLAPGSRRLMEDCTTEALSRYACTEAAMAKLGELRATVPGRYQDPVSAMTTADTLMLATLASQASRLLTPAQVATLKKEALPPFAR